MKILPHRRRFLEGLGAAALTPFVPLTERRAEASEIPTRLVIITTPNGVSNYGKWWRVGGSENAPVLSDILSPLEPFKDRMLAYENLANKAYNGRPTHSKASSQLLTGADSVSVVDGKTTAQIGDHLRSTGPSIDHYIAAQLDNPFPVLNWGMLSLPITAYTVDRLGAQVIYRSAKQGVVPEVNPYKMFNQVFGSFKPPSGGSAMTDPANGDRETVLDFVAKEVKSLQGRLGKFDQERLEAHFDGIRAVEKALAPANQPGMATSMDCSLPGEPKERLNYKANKLSTIGNFSESIGGMIRSAFQCDLTRIATLQLSITTTNLFGDTVGYNGSMHLRSHDGGNDDIPKYQKWFAEKPITDVLSALDSAIEPDGKSLLDHSIVVWASELSDAAGHTPNPLPVVTFGKAGGQWRTGRRLSLGNRAHSDLWITIANAMGIETNTFGRNSTGPITQVK